MALKKCLRRTWEARYVRGDGNCLWRSAARSFFGTEHYWLQLKLVTLSFAAAHFMDLHRFVLRGHFDSGIIARYSDTEQVVVGGIVREVSEMMRTDLVLLASVSHLCPVGTYAGSVSCRLICEAWGVNVNMLHPCDMLNRKRRQTNPGLGCTNSEGRVYDDARVSHTFVPQSKAPQTWRVPDKVGQGCGKFRQEISVVLVKHSQPLGNPSSAELDALPEVEADSLGVGISSGNHFAAIINTHGTTEPFPMYKCAPALYTPYDVRDEQKYTDELRQWTERNASKADSCASGVRGEGGRGGIDEAHAGNGITVGLGEEGVGKAATNNEGNVASQSAAGAGDSTAAADQMTADDTAAAADTTATADVAAAAAATVAAAVAATAATALGLAVVAALAASVAATTTAADAVADADTPSAAAEDAAASTPASDTTTTAAAGAAAAVKMVGGATVAAAAAAAEAAAAASTAASGATTTSAVAAPAVVAGAANAVPMIGVATAAASDAAAAKGAALGAAAGPAATEDVPAPAATMAAVAASDELSPTSVADAGGVTKAPAGAERSSGCRSKLDASSGNDGCDSTSCCGDNSNRNNNHNVINGNLTSGNINNGSSGSKGKASSSDSSGNQCDEPGSTAPNSPEEDKNIFPEEPGDIAPAAAAAAAAAAAKKRAATTSSIGARSMTQALGLNIAVGIHPFPTSTTATGYKIAGMNVFPSPKTTQRKDDDELIEMIGQVSCPSIFRKDRCTGKPLVGGAVSGNSAGTVRRTNGARAKLAVDWGEDESCSAQKLGGGRGVGRSRGNGKDKGCGVGVGVRGDDSDCGSAVVMVAT